MYTNPRLKSAYQNYWFDEDEAVAEKQFLAKYGPVFRGEKAHDRDEHYRSHLRDIYKIKPKGKFLDLGAHCGFLMRLAVAEYQWEIMGVEPSPLFARFAREFFKLDVRQGFVGELDLPRHSFDVVAMTDVLEHVGDPKVLLGQVHHLLKPDGLLYIKVPNGQWNRVKQALLPRQRFDIWDSREHLVHYTQKTLGKMLEASGYRVAKIHIAAPVNAGKGVHPLRLLAWGTAEGLYRLSGGWVPPLAASLIAEAHPAS
jgi:SAM-dependent methyltransferase